MQSTMSSSDYAFILNIDVFPISPDWKVLMDDIKGRGLSYSRQALSIGLQWSTVQVWHHGGGPTFANGHALLILHSKICGIELTKKRLDEAKTID
jgi:hypothetical protein